ncbi:MAG TPA: ABC transporter substrate-binding protein [Candidatus Binatia bacterium]|nr:ABC transporter substrate-binding protein [Candidatus Binatia bacterium]
MAGSVARVLWCAIAAAGLAACAATAPSPPPPPPAPPPIRVGINSASPPYSFVRDGALVGMEVDFAGALGTYLRRPVHLVDMRFEDLLPALSDQRIDLAMAGLTITQLRETRVTFSNPYLRSGLMAMMQRQDRDRYPTVASILACNARFSVVNGTTGEKFIRDRCGTNGMIYPTNSTDIAISEVRAGRSDILIQDAPIVVWAVSGNEGALALLRQPLNREDFGWAVSRSNEGLLAAVNQALAHWEADGTRAAILQRWVPYWQQLEAETARVR